MRILDISCTVFYMLKKAINILFINMCFVLFTGLFEERAIVLGKLGRHEHALAIYMSILRDVPRAVEYCDKVCVGPGLCFFCSSCICRHLCIVPACSHVIPIKVWFQISFVWQTKVPLLVSAVNFDVNSCMECITLFIVIISKQHFVAQYNYWYLSQ